MGFCLSTGLDLGYSFVQRLHPEGNSSMVHPFGIASGRRPARIVAGDALNSGMSGRFTTVPHGPNEAHTPSGALSNGLSYAHNNR